MKKLLLLGSAMLLGVASFAQAPERTRGSEESAPVYSLPAFQHNVAAKGAKISDTVVLINNDFKQLFDTSIGGRYDVATPYDTGYIFGTSIFGNTGFAEQYNRTYIPDTTLRVLGIYSIWRGTINSSTTKTVNLTMWTRGTQAALTGTKHFTSGFPNTVKATLSKPLRTLGIGQGVTVDTIKTAYFSSAVTGVNYPFYVGYDMGGYAYTSLAGDTFTIRTTRGGYGALIGQYTLSGTDTIYTTRNAIRSAAGVWKDAYVDLGYVRNVSAMPIIQYQSTVSVRGMQQNDLTFFGHYPNPANNKINVKIALARATSVTIQVVDMADHVVMTVQQPNLGVGTHEIPVNVSGLAAGNYTYAVMTANGDGLASMFTVVK